MTDGIPGAGIALELRGISKSFGVVHALRSVSLRVRAGSVHVVLGENGAGKSTLMQVAFGTLTPDAGTVLVRGREAAPSGSPHKGLGMVHQHLSLVPAMTAAENFELGGSGRLDLAAARRHLQDIAASSGLLVPADVPVREMSIVQQQRLEILKALGAGRGAVLLIMDEPTALLAPVEVEDLLRWIRGFVATGGSVILVTHKLREALAIADDITVLRRGVVVWQGDAVAASEATIADAMFPERSAVNAPSSVGVGDVRVRARNLFLERQRGGAAISDATFEVRGGEIVGVAAVEGSGQHELLLALAGLRSPTRGSLDLPGDVAFIPTDRRRDGIVPAFSLTENVALRGLSRRRGRMPWTELRQRTAALIRQFAIAAPSPDTPAGALSGGNQQRLVVARELEHRVGLVVAENPTRGLDLNATGFVHAHLRAAAAAGAAVVVHSTDLDEVLSLADRILVVFDGRVHQTARDRDLVGRAMLGAV